MTNILRAEQVTFRYPQNHQGLAPISLEIQPGEAAFVSGPSGCGKSTLARCLNGLIPHLYHGKLSGQVWLDGLRTVESRLWQLTERAGLVFQNPAAQMLAMSVEEEIIFGLENLGLAAHVIRERMESNLARFGLQALRARSPQSLSGGEQQKLALAAIVARQPPVLVLDEPLSMLDSTAASQLISHLAELAGDGTALIICEHRAEYLDSIPDLRTIHLGGPGPRTAPSPEAPLSNFPMRDVPAFQLEISELGVELGGRPILQGLNLALAGGQVVAVVGRNGVGKTTLLRTLAGLQAHSGTLRVNGETPDLGLVFQNADLQLFNATVREEILYRVPNPDMARYTWLLGGLGLGRYEATPPLLLSEGEKKRVALATVLMRSPRHGLLLDEPALGQDTAHKDMLMGLAHALAATGQLVIVTTHDLRLALQADRLLLLGPEGLAADGPPEQVVHDRAAWQHLGLLVPDWLDAARPGFHSALGSVEDRR